jgi:two-component system response regulator BasR
VGVLLIEDDLQLGAALTRALEQEDLQPTWVRRLKEAQERVDSGASWSAVVVDLTLPDGDGLELLRALRARRDAVPLVIITARDALSDRIHGLDSGADDYVVKPFAVSELIARLRAVMRRSAGQADSVWHIGDVAIDSLRQRVSVGGEPVALRPAEYRLLLALAQESPRVVPRGTLIDMLWRRGSEVTDAALEFHVHGLRRKVGGERIRTVRGVGYALDC